MTKIGFEKVAIATIVLGYIEKCQNVETKKELRVNNKISQLVFCK